MLGYESYSRDELEDMLDKEREKVKDLKEEIESIHADEYVRSVDDGMEIRRLRRCLTKMTKKWLETKIDMYKSLEELSDWPIGEAMVHSRDLSLRQLDNLDKILEKWR